MSRPGPPPGTLPFWRPDTGALPGWAWFGLTTRAGGVSLGAYAALNLGLGVGDERDAVLENRRRLRDAVGIEGEGPLLLHQVHGSAIVKPWVEPPLQRIDADGFLIGEGDPWVAVSAADCAPVAIVAEEMPRGALLHCGWRGAREEIAAHGVERLAGEGADAERLHAVIGPCLHTCCFPIGPEVAAAFDPAVLRPHPSGRQALDLPGAIAASLAGAGVPPKRIHVSSDCTSCRADLYFSHRRDGGVTGRHWALLRLLPAAGPG